MMQPHFLIYTDPGTDDPGCSDPILTWSDAVTALADDLAEGKDCTLYHVFHDQNFCFDVTDAAKHDAALILPVDPAPSCGCRSIRCEVCGDPDMAMSMAAE